MIGWGLFRIFVLGNPLRAESAGFQMHAEHGQIVGFALVFLVARSFSSGCAALTGVEAISNGVPAFQKAQVAQRRNDPADAGRHRGDPADGHHRVGREDRGPARRRSRNTTDRCPAELLPEDAGRAAGRDRVRQLSHRVSADRHGDRADPGAGGQHRVQRVPGAGIGPGAAQLPAAPIAHPRRPVGVLQRNPVPVGGGSRWRSSRSAPRSPR